MEFVGTLAALSVDPISKKGSVTFSVTDLSQALAEYDNLKDKNLTVKATRYRKKRTLSMNSYFWVLCGEMAKILKTTPDEIHLKQVLERSIPSLDEDGKPVVIAIKSHVDISRLPGYWKEINQKMDVLNT